MANKIIKKRTKSRLQEVKSYNQNTPYPIGVVDGKGIVSAEGGVVRYMVDNITYETNTATGDTSYEISYDLNKEFVYYHAEYLEKEDEVFTSNINEKIPVERPGLNINKVFQRLAEVKNLGELEAYGANFYTIHG